MSEHKLEERLNSHPILKNRIETLLDIVEDTSGNSDDAEFCVIEELRRMAMRLCMTGPGPERAWKQKKI